MNIVHVYYSLNYGGIESLLVNITRSQIESDHNVDLILLNSQEDKNLLDYLHSDVNIYHLNRKINSKSIYVVLKLNYLLLFNSYDIIHVHAPELSNLTLPLIRSKTILHIHATSAITNSSIPRFKECISISNAVNNVLKEKYNINNAHVVYNGIEFANFSQKQTNLLSNNIICIGALNNPIKNQTQIIEEFFIIKDIIKANIHIVGSGSDYDILYDLIVKLKLTERVFLLGNKTQQWIKNNLCYYDLFIQASKSEGLGIGAIESSAASVPMVLSNIEGHLEVSDMGKLCELFELDTKGDLANKILNFYNNPDLYFNLSRENRIQFKNKFDFKIFNEKLIKIYRNTLN